MKLKPCEWAEIFGHEIIDPDGWRGSAGAGFDEPLTFDDFVSRFIESTVHCVDHARLKKLRKFLA